MCHCSPSRTPRYTSTPFQIADPAVVYRANFPIGIRCRPAGIEMIERMPGTMRPRKIDASPCFPNHASALSTSETLASGILSARARTRFAPSAAPAQYSRNAPSTDPPVAHSTALHQLNLPVVAVKPASGRNSSDGTGGMIVSMRIASATPGGPRVPIRDTDQSTIVCTGLLRGGSRASHARVVQIFALSATHSQLPAAPGGSRRPPGVARALPGNGRAGHCIFAGGAVQLGQTGQQGPAAGTRKDPP